MKNNKTPYDKGEEKFWWGDNDWLPKEKRRRRMRRERNKRDKFGFGRRREDPYF